jgi:hypothetical protein
MCLKETGWEGVKWIHPVKQREQVNKVNYGPRKNREILVEDILASQ